MPGPHLDALRAAAAATKTTVVIGVNERSRHSLGLIYSSIVTIGPDGSVLNVHRKLVPMWAEELTWGGGDGNTVRVLDSAVGPLGAPACGENTNTLARFSLLAQGKLVHVGVASRCPSRRPTTTWRRPSRSAAPPTPSRASCSPWSPAPPSPTR
ncbi:nitrilase-related carbon-nitrogen hydrolase [Amycolatopsis sp. NPDC004368]